MVAAMVGAIACGDGPGDPKPGPPTIAPLALTTMEDTPVTGTVVARDGVGNTLPIELGTPQHGTATRTNNVVTYTPAKDFNGTDTISVHVTDGVQTADGTISITVGAVNDGPDVRNLSLAANEDTPLITAVATLLAAASDVEHDALTLTAVGNAMNGTVAITGSDVTFAPTHDFSGAASYEFTVSDGHLTAVATVSITVGGQNDAPVAAPDEVTTAEDTAIVIAAVELTGNDTDADEQTVMLAKVSNPSRGKVEIVDGSVKFTPEADFFGEAGFDYEVTDGAANATAHVKVKVTAVNDAPVAAADQLPGTEDQDQTIAGEALTGNDDDIDSATLTIVEVNNAMHCTVELVDGAIVFKPEADFFGDATFEYTVSDGDKPAIGAVTVKLAGVNDAPTAASDSIGGTEDAPQEILASALLVNDTDVEHDQLSVTAVGPGSHCAVELVDGAIAFTPEVDFSGDATFEYTVFDSDKTATGTVTVKVEPVNDAPLAKADQISAEVNLAASVPFSAVLGNDLDVDGPALTVVSVDNAEHCSVHIENGAIALISETDFLGAASFDYVVSDGQLESIGHVAVTVFTNEVCGDGAITGLEKCDDSNVVPGDGCSATCKVEIGYTCAGAPSTCTAVCGDGLVLGAETCDDSNTAPGDGCGATCKTEPGWTCSGTPSACAATCGDGVVLGAETCDDANTAPGDGCSATCKTEPGWTCAGTPSACTTTCGDGTKAGAEQCDDGNTVPGDGCTATCQTEFCGDGTVNNAGTEECDDGDADETDGCTTQCKKAFVCTTTSVGGGTRHTVDPVTGHCYASFTGSMSFGDAQVACVGSGGYLATITSADEEAIVLAARASGQNQWIGAADDGNAATDPKTTDNVFAWVTGEPWGAFTHFAAGQPDNDGSPSNCVRFATTSSNEWIDTNCNPTISGRLCEFDLLRKPLAVYTFTGAMGSPPSVPADGPAPAGIALVTAMQRGTGVTASSASDAFAAQGWTTAAPDPTRYFTFFVVPALGFSMRLTSLGIDQQRSAAGPTTFVVRSSVDNFASDLGTFSSVTQQNTAHSTVALGPAFANLTLLPVEFRIYAFGATAANGTFRIDNVVLSGSTAPAAP